jgi:DNA-binding MarR family transcriptional regulator
MPSGAGVPSPPAPSGVEEHTRLANHAWEALLQAHAVLMKQFAAEDIWTEVSMREYDVLYTLSKSREPIRLGELHRHVLLSQPALSRLVDRLVTRRLVSRAADPGDARVVLLSLTEAGRAQQRRVGRRHARSVAAALTASLTAEELGRLSSLCAQLARRRAASATLTNKEDEGL